jgi:TRAP-type C4-dicarboxylate transport system substrate-binding protein
MKSMWRVGLAIMVCLALGAAPALAQDKFEFKISVDTTMNHPRNQGLLIFIDELKKQSNGRLVPTLYPSAQLYKDTHVMKALTLGTVEMAAPGIWQLESYDPNASITSLPMFYGQPPEATLKLVDGEWGRTVAESLGKKIKVKIPGRWYELGYVHLHSCTKKITKLSDIAGMKIRYFGSGVNAMRIKAMGGNPVMISWADVPMALVQGTVDGLITTFKSADSSKLDEAGLKYSFKDYELYGQYVPMISLKFWDKLPKDLQDILVKVWEGQVDKQREMARKMQDEAEDLLKKRGVEVVYPSQETLKEIRDYIMPHQAPYVKEVGMDPALVNMAKDLLGM